MNDLPSANWQSLAPCLLLAAMGAIGCSSVLPGDHFDGLLQNTTADPADVSEAWANAIPTGLPRADVIVPLIRPDLVRVCEFGDQSKLSQLANGRTEPLVIERISKAEIRDLAGLIAAADAFQASSATNIELQLAGEPSGIEATPQQLAALAQAAAAEQTAVRMNYAGRPAAVVRQAGKRFVVTSRVLRSKMLLQLAITTSHHWGTRELLPNDVTAACDGVPLRCLTLPETLELLYGKFEPDSRNESLATFAQVSEREDYLVPTNYQRLQAVLESEDRSFAHRRQPLLIELTDVEYPGPALLGDARALNAFLQQREFMQPGDPERIGWIMFTGPDLRKGKRLTVGLRSESAATPLEFVLAN